MKIIIARLSDGLNQHTDLMCFLGINENSFSIIETQN